MTVIVLIEIPVVAAASLYLAHRILRSHQEIMAAVVGRKARDVRDALGEAEGRISQAARTGLVSRYGPARLKDQPSEAAR
jgi:hypothetical protein